MICDCEDADENVYGGRYYAKPLETQNFVVIDYEKLLTPTERNEVVRVLKAILRDSRLYYDVGDVECME